MSAMVPEPFARAVAAASRMVGAMASTYTAPSGPPVPCATVMRRDLQPAPNGLAAQPVIVADLLAADVPSPQIGATLEVGHTTYIVDGLIDDDGAVVTVAVRPC